MSKKEGYSRKGLFSIINHCAENGRKTGHSNLGFWGIGFIMKIKYK